MRISHLLATQTIGIFGNVLKTILKKTIFKNSLQLFLGNKIIFGNSNIKYSFHEFSRLILHKIIVYLFFQSF